MFETSSIPILEQVVQFTQARHGVLAGNIANIDTPGYQSRDLSPAAFEARLRGAIDRRDSPLARYGIGEPSNERNLHEVADSMKSILYHDESDVSMERQVAEISKNQAQHNLALTILVSQFELLKTAISERV